MIEDAIKMIEDNIENVRYKLQRECNKEQLECLESIMPHDSHIRVFETIEATKNLFADSLKMGIAALLSCSNALIALNEGNAEKALLPLSMGIQACTLFLGQDQTFEALANMERSIIKKSATRAGKASCKKKYPWREKAKELARQRWQEEDILHTELADWLINEYQAPDGKYPFSGILKGIDEGNERRAMLKLLKELAKKDFPERHLIKGTF